MSRVKVNIDRLKLIEVLEGKLAAIEEGSSELPEVNKELIKHLENCIEAVKKDEDIPRCNWRNEHNYGVWDAYQYRHEPYAYDLRHKKKSEPLKLRLEKQIAILKLSDDDKVSVGVNDELYELL